MVTEGMQFCARAGNAVLENRMNDKKNFNTFFTINFKLISGESYMN
jgi:hypothetical protein